MAPHNPRKNKTQSCTWKSHCKCIMHN
jgi:hypothetical protein